MTFGLSATTNVVLPAHGQALEQDTLSISNSFLRVYPRARYRAYSITY
jgi:hypothetical protein